jgi:hypothetical protein
MGNTLSCANDNQNLQKSKSNYLERYRPPSAEMNSKSSEKLKSDNNLRKITDNDKKLNSIENKIIIDDGIEKVRIFLNLF